MCSIVLPYREYLIKPKLYIKKRSIIPQSLKTLSFRLLGKAFKQFNTEYLLDRFKPLWQSSKMR